MSSPTRSTSELPARKAISIRGLSISQSPGRRRPRVGFLGAGHATLLLEKTLRPEHVALPEKAEVTYDILAERGGARPYSRLSPLQMWAIEGDGAPTSGMKQVLEGLEKEIAAIEPEVTTLFDKDVAGINARAQKLGVAFVVK